MTHAVPSSDKSADIWIPPHPTNLGKLKVGCDRRANANAGAGCAGVMHLCDAFTLHCVTPCV